MYPNQACLGKSELISCVFTPLHMGRKSTTQHLIKELEEDDPTEEVYLVAYDFIEEKPSTRFWNNLNEIIAIAGGSRVQYSVYHGNRRGARLVKALAEHYGADVKWYAAFEIM